MSEKPIIFSGPMVLDLNPKPDPQAKVQCSEPYDAENDNAHYVRHREEKCRRHGKSPDFCFKTATYSVDGKPFCKVHAGIRLIDMATKGREK